MMPKEDKFYELLEKQAAVAVAAATALAVRDSAVELVCEAVQRVEHEGDVIVCEVETALAKTFVTPIDREDIHKLSSELDDITDLCNLTARSASLYHIEALTDPMRQLTEVLMECTRLLNKAVPLLRSHDYEQLMVETRAVKVLEKKADTIFRAAIGDLFKTPSNPVQLMKEKEVLEDIERAIDKCNTVATTLTNLAVKHG
jgi:uncharacterized protein Yka (UPF0111/DUF47 family)